MKNPETISDIFKVGTRLPEDYDRMRKVNAIQDIARLRGLLSKRPLSTDAFQELYDSPYYAILEYQNKLEAEMGRRVAKNGGPQVKETKHDNGGIVPNSNLFNPDSCTISGFNWNINELAQVEEIKPLKQGDWVKWTGNLLCTAPQDCRICRIEHLKLLQCFESVPLSDKDDFIFILSNGYWAYGWQIEILNKL